VIEIDIEWRKLQELAVKEFNDLQNIPGIYFVRWSKNGKPEPVPRLRGVDKQGLLYIGRAKKLKMRVKQLWNGINRKGRHTIGKTIIFSKIFELICLDEFEIAWKETESHEEAIGQEWTAIHEYSKKHKEPPPLNLSLRNEMFAILGLAKLGRSLLTYRPNEFVKSIIS